MRLLVCGGGTAGHIQPVLATLEAIKKYQPDIAVLYVGSRGSIESRIVRGSGFEFRTITTGKYRRYHNRSRLATWLDFQTLFLNIRDVYRLLAGIWQTWQIMAEFKPNIVFTKGGYVSLPVGIVAIIRRCPLIIHESDTTPGLANRILSRKAKVVAVGWPANKYSRGAFAGRELEYTGIPIRANLISADRLTGMKHFKLLAGIPVVLVVGGSQGAVRINTAIIKALPKLISFCQIIHITGENDIERVRQELAGMSGEVSKYYQAHSFLGSEMGLALAASDVVVARAGASTISELAVLHKATILIPGSQLSGGHQLAQARMFAREGSVRVITEDQMSTEVIVGELQPLCEQPELREVLGQKLARYATVDADTKLAKLILQTAKAPGGKVEHNE